ncbi:hypothetical protein GGP63_003296 [Salinibacter ruber]|uniref:Uncharacterized protein n=1 Tax=Salinibacter ruber TaxID=146919 RepID=A0AAW5PBI5_9BACT|nr:hypothetical protein [Salinibacter ruber]MCS4159566.1 hypothetical protein [Salinibacter ruber]
MAPRSPAIGGLRTSEAPGAEEQDEGRRPEGKPISRRGLGPERYRFAYPALNFLAQQAL